MSLNIKALACMSFGISITANLTSYQPVKESLCKCGGTPEEDFSTTDIQTLTHTRTHTHAAYNYDNRTSLPLL